MTSKLTEKIVPGQVQMGGKQRNARGQQNII